MTLALTRAPAASVPRWVAPLAGVTLVVALWIVGGLSLIHI